MSEDKPHFKPNVSMAGARRGRRARAAQLVPQAPSEARGSRGRGGRGGRGGPRLHQVSRGAAGTWSAQGAAGGRGGASGPTSKSEPTLEPRPQSAGRGSGTAVKGEPKEEGALLIDDGPPVDDEWDSDKSDPGDEPLSKPYGRRKGVLLPLSLPVPEVERTEEPADESIGTELLAKDSVCILQLPGILPVNLPTGPSQLHDLTEEEEKAKSVRSDLRTVEPGSVPFGKLCVYKSGRVKLVMADGVEMEVNRGAHCDFSQHLFEINSGAGEAVDIAGVDKRFVGVPDLEVLLAETAVIK